MKLHSLFFTFSILTNLLDSLIRYRMVSNTMIFINCMQHSGDKDRYFDRVLKSESAVDFIIVDVPEGLHIPTISAPPAPIPTWNVFGEDWLVPIFDFAEEYLHDDGGLLIMYPLLSRAHRSQLLGCCEEYKFRILNTWTDMNPLHLTSPVDPSRTVIFNLAILMSISIFYFYFI